MDSLRHLIAITKAPSDPAAFTVWLNGSDFAEWLRHNAASRHIVMYAGLPALFVHAVPVPAKMVTPPDPDDLLKWNVGVPSGWGVSARYGEPESVHLSPPLHSTGSAALDAGDPLIFHRFFERRMVSTSYTEVAEQFVQVSGLHLLHERHAYCRLDENGDIEDAIRLSPRLPDGTKPPGSVVTFDRELVDQWLALNDMVLLLMFDIWRFRGELPSDWQVAEAKLVTVSQDLVYRHSVEPGVASHARGFQVIRPHESREALLARAAGEQPEERQYASFIAHDFKSGVVREINCGPGNLASYFATSDLPFEMSPAFFRPEVLLKYKADSDKYELRDRELQCRGAWTLQTLDINEAGQVHTYIIYLRHLPYSEQLHWKSFNEPPKAAISKRAFTSDFEGKFDLDYDALPSLKAAITEIERRGHAWWERRSAKLLQRTNYPVTNAADEWGSELLNLDQLVVEGFGTRWLRDRAAALGRTLDPKWGSLKLLEQCLIGLGVDEESAKGVTAPFHELHHLRSVIKSHSSSEDMTKLKQRILSESHSYREHFIALTKTCDESLRTISKILE